MVTITKILCHRVVLTVDLRTVLFYGFFTIKKIHRPTAVRDLTFSLIYHSLGQVFFKIQKDFGENG
jgi:hypothetical protein